MSQGRNTYLAHRLHMYCVLMSWNKTQLHKQLFRVGVEIDPRSLKRFSDGRPIVEWRNVLEGLERFSGTRAVDWLWDAETKMEEHAWLELQKEVIQIPDGKPEWSRWVHAGLRLRRQNEWKMGKLLTEQEGYLVRPKVIERARSGVSDRPNLWLLPALGRVLEVPIARMIPPSTLTG